MLTAVAIAVGLAAVAFLAPRLWVACWDRAEAEANEARRIEAEHEKWSAGIEANIAAKWRD